MRRACLALVLVLTSCVHGLSPPRRSLVREADLLLALPESEGAVVGAYAIDAATGEPLYVRAARTRSLPASTQKVITTAAALGRFGKDFRYRTPIVMSGVQRGELFEGELVAVASGDPSFGSWRWPETQAAGLCEQIATSLLAAGVRRFKGGIGVRGVELPFEPTLGPGWSWDDVAYDYSAVPKGFVFRENVIDLTLTRSPASACEPSSVRVNVSPAVEGMWVDFAFDPRGGSSLECTRQLGSTRVRCAWHHAAGTCPTEARLKITVDEPAALFSSCVAEALTHVGITLAPTRTMPPAAVDRELLAISSPPLGELVKATNKESLNLYAERLAMLLAKDQSGAESYGGVRDAINAFLLTRGVDPLETNITDGSGLSRYNMVTAHALAAVLQTSLQEPSGETLLQSLPVLGVDGTLGSHQVPEGVKGRVRAKSGSMSGQKAFVGIAERPGDAVHPKIVFALLFGNVLRPKVAPGQIFDLLAEILVNAPLQPK